MGKYTKNNIFKIKKAPQGSELTNMSGNGAANHEESDHPVSYTHLTLPTIYSV